MDIYRKSIFLYMSKIVAGTKGLKPSTSCVTVGGNENFEAKTKDLDRECFC